jgi:VWFA-related protein
MPSILNIFPFSLLLVGFSSLAFAQSPTSPTQSAQSSNITLKSSAQIVIVDVIVSGKNGNPVHGLKATEFNLTENGKNETITHFEEHLAPSPEQMAAPIAPLRLPSGVFTNYSPRPTAGPLNILLLDKLNTPFNDQDFVLKQLVQFLKNSPQGSRIAIFGLTTHLLMLQGFTSDPELLMAAIKKPQVNGMSPNLNNDPVTGAPIQSEKLSDQVRESGIPSGLQVVELMKEFEAVQTTAQTELRVRYTLDAMNQLALYLSGIPGRKNLMWFSGSFPINILPDTSGQLQDPFTGIASAEKEFRETTNLFTRSQVAVYPIDATGLYSAGMKSLVDASNDGSKYAQPPTPPLKGGPLSLPTFSQGMLDAEATRTDTQQTMYRMASDTGGHAFVNTNNLANAVSQAITLGSTYYTLTYSPSNHTADGRFRKIQVKLPHENYNLAYRHGYYAGDPNVPTKTKNIAAAPDHYNPMQTAMIYGAPSATQIIFKIAVDRSPEEQETLAPGNTSPTKAKGPFQLFNVQYAVSRNSIEFLKGSDGTHQGAIGFDVLVYNQDGVIVNSATSLIKANLSTEAFDKLLTLGVQFKQPISIPVKGKYYLRVGIHDIASNRVGAVEIPVATIKDLSPTIAPSSPAKPAEAK